MSTSPKKPLSVRKTPRFLEAIATLAGQDPVAREALLNFERVIANLADHGMAVPGFSDVLSWPVHLSEDRSILVVDRVKDTEVVCLSARRIASPSESRDH